MRGIVITGASSGLGAKLAEAYAAPETLLAIVGRNTDRLSAVARRCEAKGSRTEILSQDVAETEPLGAWLTRIDARAPVHLIIANAGISGGPPSGRPYEGLDLAKRQVMTNLVGVVNTVEPLLPNMVQRRSGRIAVIASIAAFRGLPYSPAYCASKAGVRAYGEALRPLVAKCGIRVSVVSPGFFDSPMTDRWKGHTPFLMSTENAARIVKRGIDKGKARITFPTLLAAGMRMADVVPAWLGDMIVRNFRFQISDP